jgi:hypothetical protein
MTEDVSSTTSQSSDGPVKSKNASARASSSSRRSFVRAGALGAMGLLMGSGGLASDATSEVRLEPPGSLLDEVIAAQGGLERWRRFTRFSVHMSLYGGLFDRKGHGGGELAHLVCDGTTKGEFLRMTGFREPELRLVYTPDRVSLERVDGTVLQARDNPREAFVGHTAMTQWDDLHLAYFSGYANWNYFVVPFVFADAGF